MNAKSKRRAAVSKTARQESAAKAGGQEAARATEWWEATADLPSQGRLILSEHLPESRFVRLEVNCGDMFPCNPSIAKDDKGRLAVIVRCVNYLLGEEDGIWFRDDPGPNTHNYFGFLDDDLDQSEFRFVDDVEVRRMRAPAQHGLEDARLVWWKDGWWFICTALHHGARIRGTMALCQLQDHRVSHLEFLHSMHGREIEKNWPPAVDKDGRLLMVYKHHPAEAYELAPTRRRLHLDAFPSLEGWSGGSQLIPHDGGWLSVVHQRRKDRNRVFYVHRLVRYNSGLCPVHAGREFYFRGSQVEFCSGLVEHRGEYVLSFGVKDREAWLVRLSEAHLASLMAAQ